MSRTSSYCFTVRMIDGKVSLEDERRLSDLREHISLTNKLGWSKKYVKLQGDSFQRLGILGSFDNPYLTLNPKYEAGILEVLAELVQRDLVYRQKKPVHWCTNDRTALAEAELEYANRKDHSIYVSFGLEPQAEARAPDRRRHHGIVAPPRTRHAPP